MKTIKLIQCAYCKADSERFKSIGFNSPQLIRIIENVENYSSYGCDNCKNYYNHQQPEFKLR